LRRIYKSYGRKDVLRGIDFDLYPGEVVSVIGPSGCGKTTLLKLMNLIHLPDHGEIVFDGKVLYSHDGGSDDRSLWIRALHSLTGHYEHTARIRLHGSEIHHHRRNFGMVFQEFNLWPNLTLFENIAAPLKWSMKLQEGEVRQRVEDVAEQVQIAAQLRNYPGEVSGGQKQRAGIARALVVHPRVLLLDEITSALDPELVTEMLRLIASLRDVGRTMVIVTHHMSFAAQISDRIAFFADGLLLETGDPKEFFESPRSGKAKAFLAIFNEHKL
jgi:polar amino acid transport system ATP-binding protein